ncbi:MAG: hypothetical protein ACYCOY_02075 [Metallibacterium sp.]
MPKRKIRESLLPPDVEAATIALIKEAHQHARRLTPEQLEWHAALPRVTEADGWAARSAWVITRTETRSILRKGKIVYREPGNGGADYPVPPHYWRMLKQHRDFETGIAKMERSLRLRYVSAPKAAAARAEHIRAIAATIPKGRGRIKAVARAAHVDVRTVRRVLKP